MIVLDADESRRERDHALRLVQATSDVLEDLVKQLDPLLAVLVDVDQRQYWVGKTLAHRRAKTPADYEVYLEHVRRAQYLVPRLSRAEREFVEVLAPTWGESATGLVLAAKAMEST